VASGITKAALLKWADERYELDLESKVILRTLASLADEDCYGWAKVETLALAANCSIRTAQMRLKALKAEGYLFHGGDMHRLKNSTRSVPLYLTGPDALDAWEAADLAVQAGRRVALDAPADQAEAAGSMGAEPAPIDGAHGCKSGGGMGATVCTRIDPKDPSESSDELSTGASAREALGFEKAIAAWPMSGLKRTRWAKARRGWAEACRLVSPASLLAAVLACATDPDVAKGDFGWPALDNWLADECWRAWLIAAERAAPVEASRTAFAGPAAAVPLRAELDGIDPAAAACLDKAEWLGEGLIRAATTWALERLRGHEPILARHGFALLAPGAATATIKTASGGKS
jgi:hypothetical protein